MDALAACDVLISGARVVDGTGNPWFYGDVAIDGERIAAVTPPGVIDRTSAREVVDASGQVVCPGFIDILSHSIVPFFSDRRSVSKVTQGVTTEIMGEDWTPAPYGGCIPDWVTDIFPLSDEVRELIYGWRRFGDWLDYLSAEGTSVNFGAFVSGGTIRTYARGRDRSLSSPDEQDLMRRLMAEAMEDGALGVCYALIYPPDVFVDTDEIIEVCKVAASYGGIYITHIRSESDELLEALGEAMEIGRRAGIPVEIHHLKASGERNWHKLPEAIRMINEARASGLDITANMYPYPAGGSGLTASLPPWALADNKLLDNLRDPSTRQRIRADILGECGDWEPLANLSEPDGVLLMDLHRPENQQYAGKRLSKVAEMRGQHWVDAMLDLILSEEYWIGTIYFTQSEENLPLQVCQPWIKFATDCPGVDPDDHEDVLTHPRGYGTYPRVLGRYVREEGILTLEDAIRKMTSSVANRLGLHDRGLLRSGCYADVVVFDPKTVIDRATYENPHQLSSGVRDVWVNGQRVLRDGRHTGAHSGRRLYGAGGG